MNRVGLELEMGTPSVRSVIDKSYALARNLGVNGTPTFIIGDEIIPGAIGLDGLRTRIANMRECGRTSCPPADAGSESQAARPADGHRRSRMISPSPKRSVFVPRSSKPLAS